VVVVAPWATEAPPAAWGVPVTMAAMASTAALTAQSTNCECRRKALRSRARRSSGVPQAILARAAEGAGPVAARRRAPASAPGAPPLGVLRWERGKEEGEAAAGGGASQVLLRNPKGRLPNCTDQAGNEMAEGE